MKRTAEVAIVGGGVIGASVAYHLSVRGVRNVVVFEREEALGTGSTGKCAGGVRLEFSNPANVAMSRLSLAQLKRFEEEMGTPIDFRQNGYLFVLSDESQLGTFRDNASRLRELGVPVEVLTPEEARRLVPEMAIDDLAGATFGSEDGITNPHALVQGYAKKAKELGVRFCTSVAVGAMEVFAGRVQALFAGGERWDVDAVVNAAGPWAARVGEMVGVEIPVEPYRRMVFVTAPLAWIPDSFPMLIDWGTGVYMHKESGGMLMGESDRDEPPSFNQRVDWDFLARVSEHATRRIPLLAEAEIRNGWAGLYETTPDHNAILGVLPGLENFVCANGFSGHGMMHAPAVGLSIAELLTEGASRSVDLAPYSIERFQDRKTEPELNVI
ncbi:MAG TPA: FAD-dependent oxidoreductase [Vicinamibacteria bacterium]